MYGKVFRQMYKGSMSRQGWESIVTMQQFIVLADRHGVVDMTLEAIAAETTIPIEVLRKGIEILSAPDRGSRTPDDDGRRIVPLDDRRDWGWQLVNYEKYRKIQSEEDRREYQRAYWHVRKDKKKTQQHSTDSIHAEVDAEAEVKAEASKKNPDRAAAQPDRFVEIRAVYPKRSGSHRWQDAHKHYRARLAEGDYHETIKEGVARYAAFVKASGKDGTEYVMQAATFLGKNRAYLEPWTPPPSKAQVKQDANISASMEWLSR
jgi:hypothetical protein